eukprot:2683386-Amphidinium_carterae.1
MFRADRTIRDPAKRAKLQDVQMLTSNCFIPKISAMSAMQPIPNRVKPRTESKLSKCKLSRTDSLEPGVQDAMNHEVTTKDGHGSAP